LYGQQLGERNDFQTMVQKDMDRRNSESGENFTLEERKNPRKMA
jgi:hypothetical protein